MAPPGMGTDPLADHPKYEKVKDLNAGAFGFVQLARNRATGRHVAIKFLPRGERIGRVSLMLCGCAERNADAIARCSRRESGDGGIG